MRGRTRPWATVTRIALLVLLLPFAFLALPAVSASATVSSVTIDNINNGDTVSGTKSVQVSFTSDAIATTPITVTYSDDAGTFATHNLTMPVGSDSASWNTTRVTDGSGKNLTVSVNDGSGSASNGKTVTVANATPSPFTVTVTQPSGSSVAGTVTITATASNSASASNTLVSMIIKVDGTQVGASQPMSGHSGSGSVSWNTTGYTNASHAITATTTDSDGATDQGGKSVTVNNATPSPFTVSVTSPTSGSTAQGTVALVASASNSSAASNTLNSVSFAIDGSTVGTDTTVGAHGGTASVNWNSVPAANGPHSVTATTHDSDGQAVTSAAVSFTVSNAHPAPVTVTLTPANGTTVGGIVAITANAQNDPAATNTLSSVKFVVDSHTLPPTNGVALSGHQDSGQVNWDTTGLANGSHHTLTATVKDSDGASYTATTSVTVDNSILTVNLSAPAPNAAVTGSQVTVTANANTNSAPGSAALQSLAFTATPSGGSPVSIGSQPLSGSTGSASVTWDSTPYSGPVTLTATVTDANGGTATSTIVVTVSTPAPSVTINAPAANATVSGVVPVNVHVASDTAGSSFPASIAYTVDGQPMAVPAGTATASHPLAGSATTQAVDDGVQWDTAGLSGAHTVAVTVTDNYGHLGSAQLVVTVNNPAPSVALSIPTTPVFNGLPVVSGTVPVTASLATSGDLASSFPASVTYRLDGRPVATHTVNAAGQHQVSDTLSWDTSKVSGSHTLTATMLDTTNGTATSAPVVVQIFSRADLITTRVSLKGQKVTYRIALLSLSDGQGAPGQPVKITITDALKHLLNRTVVTGPDGTVRTTLTLLANSRIAFSYAGTPVYGPTTHALSLKIAAPGACRLTPTTVGRSARAAGSCTVARLPKGSKATLQYRFKGKWIVLASGKSRGGGLHFTVRFAVPGKYAIQLILSASSVYTRTVINVPSLRVR